MGDCKASRTSLRHSGKEQFSNAQTEDQDVQRQRRTTTNDSVHEEDRSQSCVDYAPNDFRRSFQIINQAAMDSLAYAQGGDVVRSKTDGVLRQRGHNMAYSHYWHLDPSRAKNTADDLDEPARDNIIEEYYSTEDFAQIKSPDSHDSGIQLEYAKPSRANAQLPEEPVERGSSSQLNDTRSASDFKSLPVGWERHEDPRGYSYYWHVDSGTVQREPPSSEAMRAVSYVEQSSGAESNPSSSASSTINEDSAATQLLSPARSAGGEEQSVIIETAFKQTTLKKRVEYSDRRRSENSFDHCEPIRFAVRSLGWTEIAEENLTPERSSRAVNQAIVDLSTGRNDFIDNVAKWGDGKELIMELDDRDICLFDPDSNTVLLVQPICNIRVWGVGRDNGRDFAYVARDRSSQRFMCHVFRCDTPARTIANTLRDICKRLMLERRPTTLPHSSSGLQQGERKTTPLNSFPTPMEEPKKVVRCHFLGVTQVPRATGIEVINDAVDRLVMQLHPDRWVLVDVGIAPSTISITEVGGNQIAECRVRYLSFLGIGQDIKHCAFIMQMSSQNYMCYVFHVEPSAGAMAKTIEAACKLRYQKVIDAHGERKSYSRARGVLSY